MTHHPYVSKNLTNLFRACVQKLICPSFCLPDSVMSSFYAPEGRHIIFELSVRQSVRHSVIPSHHIPSGAFVILQWQSCFLYNTCTRITDIIVVSLAINQTEFVMSKKLAVWQLSSPSSVKIAARQLSSLFWTQSYKNIFWEKRLIGDHISLISRH